MEFFIENASWLALMAALIGLAFVAARAVLEDEVGERLRDTAAATAALMPTGLRLEVQTVTAEGDRVVVEAIGNAVTGEGKPYCNEYCFVATLEDGRIKQFNEYLCTRLAEDVLWPLVEKMGALKADAV